MVVVIRKCFCCGREFAAGVFGFRCDYCQDSFAWTSHGRVGKAHPPCRPKKHAPDVVESAASVSISPSSEVSASEADSNPATTQVM
jgi:hypothetical protein